MTNKTITIPLDYYKQLMEYEMQIRFLEQGGVDNWEWYGEAMNPDDKDYDEHVEELMKECDIDWEKDNTKSESVEDSASPVELTDKE